MCLAELLQTAEKNDTEKLWRLVALWSSLHKFEGKEFVSATTDLFIAYVFHTKFVLNTFIPFLVKYIFKDKCSALLSY